nr:immunoglobulin heavy chain junction region [Mus musculus]
CVREGIYYDYDGGYAMDYW